MARFIVTSNFPTSETGSEDTSRTVALTFANIATGEIEDSVRIAGWDTIADESEL